MATKLLSYAVPATLLRGAVLRVPEDFASIGAAVSYLRGKTCLNTTIDVAPGNYNESLIISDISTGGAFNASVALAATTPTAGILGVHGLELRARNYTDGMTSPSVSIQGLVSFVRDVGVFGFRATLNTLPEHLLYGFAAMNGGVLSCYDCQAIGAGHNINNNFGSGFAALSNGLLRAKKAIVSNLQFGLITQHSGIIHADGASAQDNRGYQVYAAQESIVSVNNLIANGINGIYSAGNSNVWATNSAITGTALGTGIGILATHGGYVNGQNAQVTLLNQGFHSTHNGKLDATNGIASNCTSGFFSNTGSYITAGNTTARNCTTGYFANLGSTLHAPNTLARASGNGTNYSPGTSGTPGNTNSFIFFT
jgi:hypothetical protein